ncbi:TOMM system kinase/cyclase fusion protein, partial [Flavobacteriaceae bacterium (ex Bugula neritina AB1)]
MKDLSIHQEPILVPEIDNYILLEKLGEGGYGHVYKAEQKSTGQLVAVKLLRFKDSIDNDIRNRQILRFDRETRLCAEINHPNIVKLIDKGHTKNQEVYAVYEFISGETLQDFILKNKEVTPAEVSELMKQVLEALISAHSKGIIHRDLKPQNIMVSQTGARLHIKVLDFGIGTFTNDSQMRTHENLTLTREVIGTPAYCAPEQLRGEPTTIKSDLYAWGLIFMECLTGQPVITGESVAEMFQKQLDPSNITIPASIAGHPLADLLRRVLEKRTDHRIANAELIYEEFSKINFHTLVGDLGRRMKILETVENSTLVNEFDWKNPTSEKRQLTVLCVKLSLLLSKNSNLDLETQHTIQKDQLNLCTDTAIRFGGYLVGKFADNLMIYFGYPKINDTDARRAGRTALELVNKVHKRNALLNVQHGVSLDIRISLHSGTVVSSRNNIPEGLVPNMAFNLLYNAGSGSILVSETSKKLLDPYLEFEISKPYTVSNLQLPLQAYLLIGERKTEAFSFLRPWSANRKMIGREIEFEQILNLWETITPEKGKAVLIEGQAGIGKSKLIHECKTSFENQGYIVQECRCLPEHQNNALYPFLETLRKQVRGHNSKKEIDFILELECFLNKIGCDLKETIPMLCSWLSLDVPDTYQVSHQAPERQKEIVLDTLHTSLLFRDTEEKFVFIIEDLHWIDPTSQEFLLRIIESLKSTNCLLLMTTRPEFLVNITTEVLHFIKLSALPTGTSKSLIESIVNNAKVAKEAVDYINHRADGVPLFIEELTQMLLDQKYLIKKNNEYELIDSLDEKSIPITLKELLHARLDHLGFAKETAQLAAAIGREFDYKLLVSSSLYDEARVQADLETLIKANLIYRQRKVNDESYFFRHALIRDGAYEGMLNTYRKEVHSRIAEVMKTYGDKLSSQNPFKIATHLVKAENYIEAIDFGRKAAESSLEKSANLETKSITNSVLEWVKNIKEPIQKNEIQFKL